MKNKAVALVAVAALLFAAGLLFGQTPAPAKPQPDPRIDKLLEQNEKILKNQEDIQQTLKTISDGVQGLRRRMS